VTIALFFRAAGCRIAAAAILAASALSGCATPPTDPAERAVFIQNNDPLEPLNRKILSFNDAVDKVLLRPAAKIYVFTVPEDGRRAIRHVLDNMKEPTLFFNHVLQGELKRAGITLGRFIVNSMIGVGGIVDVMALNGVERQPADFGQTLFVWGVPSGPYIIIPILGPSNPRDAIGRGVDSYADPFTILANEAGVTELTTARFVGDGVDERASVLDLLDDLQKNSVDFYAQLRSLTQQHRNAELHHGETPAAQPGLYDDPDGSTKPGGSAPQTPASPGQVILSPAPSSAPPAQPATSPPVLLVPAAQSTPQPAPLPQPAAPPPKGLPPPPSPAANPTMMQADPDEGPLRR
jgi:phospholipid-binding lipoprotein MlaA